jgi:zinc transport system substrate-binding protein
VVILLLLTGVLSGCGHRSATESDRPGIGVTTSYIECAVTDVAVTGFRIVRVLPPGGCPGHFDITPGTIDQLRQTSLLLRFQFQQSLDAKLERLTQAGLKVVPLPSGKGLCIPATYLSVCQAVCVALCDRWPDQAASFRRRLAETQARLDKLAGECRDMIRQSQLSQTKVLASDHQAAFCEWLGLAVAGRFSGGEASKLSELTDSLASGRKGQARLVIANRQEGDQLARSLAERLGVPFVVLSNFPSMEPGQQTFDELIRANVADLIQGVKR